MSSLSLFFFFFFTWCHRDGRSAPLHVHPDKVAVASIPESILTTSLQQGEAAAAAAGRRWSPATHTHTHAHTTYKTTSRNISNLSIWCGCSLLWYPDTEIHFYMSLISFYIWQQTTERKLYISFKETCTHYLCQKTYVLYKWCEFLIFLL